MQLGATSPQEVAAKIGNRYVISRSNVLKHRQTLQPGEVAPGDLGNTNPAQNDGTSKAGGGTKQGGGTGGNTKESKVAPISDNKVITIERDDIGRPVSYKITTDNKEGKSNEQV